MNRHTSFEYVLQKLAVVMTQPSFQNFVTIVTVWIFVRRADGHRNHAGGWRDRVAAPFGLSALCRPPIPRKFLPKEDDNHELVLRPKEQRSERKESAANLGAALA